MIKQTHYLKNLVNYYFYYVHLISQILLHFSIVLFILYHFVNLDARQSSRS
jgi:hypothetical protein